VGDELPTIGTAAGMTVNVVGEQDGRLVIDTLVSDPAEHHCAATLDGLAHFRLRLYMAAAELVPVLTEELEHAFDDGTKLRLARGVPVPAGGAELDVRGTPIRVPVPAERTGRSYTPGQPFSSEGGDGKLYPLPRDAKKLYTVGHALTYGDETLDEAHLYRAAGNVVRFGSTPKDAGALVTVRNPCLEVTALASNERLKAPPSFDALEEDIVARQKALEGDEWDELGLVGAKPAEVAAGTAITWADGLPAGQVTATHRFTTAPREQGGRSCFDVELIMGQAPTVTLCFAPGDVGSGAGSGTGADVSIGAKTGAGFGGRGKAVPTVSQAKATVTGALDSAIIRRIVRAHINEVRECYDKGLGRDPTLAGDVSIQATIGAEGKVSAATVAADGTTLTDAAVGKCIAKAFKGWTFPKPSDGGKVELTYPFALAPG
jgi:hypothetical protein